MYLAEFREVVLLTKGALPQPCLIIADRLVIALTLRTPVGDASDVADDQFSWRKGKTGRGKENGEQAKRTREVTVSHQPFSDRISVL